MALRCNFCPTIVLRDPVHIYIYISRYLHIYRYLHTRCLHHQISYILLGTVEEALEVCSLDLVIYCHVFTNPSRAELGTGRGQILADC